MIRLPGHRIVEIGCLELVNHIPTSRTFHRYINPEMDVHVDAIAVHGLTNEMLAKHPVFAEIAEHFLEFIADAPLVIHNAEFDMRFLNHELSRLGFPAMPDERALCTLKTDKGNAIRARLPILTRYASGSASIMPDARCTAPCWTRSCWPKFTWSCWAGGRTR